MTALPSYSPVLILATCGVALACSLVVKPRDEVERCGTAEDCSPTGDERYVPLCKFDDDNLDLDSTKIDKICVASFKSITCDPDRYNNSPNGFQDKVEEDACTALGCSTENLGKIGCPRESGGECESGLDPDDDGICVDEDADQPVISASYLSDNDLPGDQHIRDQFCKSYFCDDTFVCGASGNCQPCDPDADYGEGGCGIVYAEGAPARIYVLGNDLEDECRGSDASTEEPAVFGECS
jgi:hypothetical protein